ncbi:MAG: hypothetical protein A2X18_03395 [Bacteroidetes bacterium GWF2_40_14]|nr:MAG: hypothetical protein A2X18_03395 [Bacteroidetes bacterium GWF2_40_14]
MKKHLLTLTLVLVAVAMTAQNPGIRFFHGSWEEAVQKAKAENKLIFIDFYTKWCGPCKNMADEVFVTRAVGDFYNSNFINCKIDAETAEGAPIARKYKVGVYPTFVFVDPATLNEVHSSTSRQDEEIFIFTGQSALTKDKNSVNLEKMALEGSSDPLFLYNYAFYKASKYDREAADKYMSELLKIKTYELSNLLIWRYFTIFVKDKNNKLAMDFVNQKSKYEEIYGKDVVSELLFSLFRNVRSEKELDQAPEFQGKEYIRKKLRLSDALNNKDYATAKNLSYEIMQNPDGRLKEFCSDINFLIRMPFSKDGGKVTIEKPLLELYFILFRFAAYNSPNRNDAIAHFNYSFLLEYCIKNKIPIESMVTEVPKAGVAEYSMRPADLAKKPVRETVKK